MLEQANPNPEQPGLPAFLNNLDVRKQYLFKEVETIQGIIKRLSGNSFLIKGWTVTLVVATLLVKATSCEAWIAYTALIMFWLLDGWFLHKERLYKHLYKWVIENRLKTTERLLDMKADEADERFANNVDSFLSVLFSRTLLWFYGPIAGLIYLYTFIFC